MRRTPGERIQAARREMRRKLDQAGDRRRVNVAARLNAVLVGDVGRSDQVRVATSNQQVEIRQSD